MANYPQNGLMQLDKHTNKVVTYFKEAGIPHNEFNRIAHFKGKDGRLYFGGLLGVTSFYPKEFAEARNQTKSSPLEQLPTLKINPQPLNLNQR